MAEGKGNAQIPIPKSPKDAPLIKQNEPGTKYGQDPYKGGKGK